MTYLEYDAFFDVLRSLGYTSLGTPVKVTFHDGREKILGIGFRPWVPSMLWMGSRKEPTEAHFIALIPDDPQTTFPLKDIESVELVDGEP